MLTPNLLHPEKCGMMLLGTCPGSTELMENIKGYAVQSSLAFLEPASSSSETTKDMSSILNKDIAVFAVTVLMDVEFLKEHGLRTLNMRANKQ